jgi:branched-chain amino acid transport system substrate-binding protein
MFKHLVTTSAFAVVLAAGAMAYGQSAKADDLVVGVGGPMTGQYASFGEQLKRGAEMAVKDINAKGGVLGKQLKLEIGDDACDPKQAVQVANDMVKKGIVFMAGHFCSGSSIPASAVYIDEGILQISPASTNPSFTEDPAAKGVKTIMRTCGRDDQQGVFAGQWLAKTYAGKNVAILDDKSTYGAGLANETERNMTEAGLKPAMRDTYTAGDKDFSAIVSKMKDEKIDAVYVGGYHPDVALMMRQAREQGFKAPFVSGDAMNTAEFWSISGPAGEGLRFSNAADAMLLDSAKAVVAEFEKENYKPEGYTLSTYAALEAFAQAANGTGGTDGEKMADWLRQNGAKTVMGELNWDDKGDLTKSTYAWYLWHDGDYKQEPIN